MKRMMGAKQWTCIGGGLSGVCGVLLLGLSFAINNGPAPGATTVELANFAQQNYVKILWGAWMQAVGPVLIVLFAFVLVHLSGSDTAAFRLDDVFRSHSPDDRESHRDHFLY